ncbi:MarR family winged helix-turn-helix transcriptional regulator [Thermobifida cellulosilytica]|uniref:HTH marR-type domain-containing protein n=1 Tax=Thermobifida cellulosilytica TB100 TaxID=665004 RepID=A0A147KLZ9_THECS|nr:MarR family transcriptional regulator [Thermobifida cellulosilytica]KUP98317.1 hypothetical protein AC529_02465 [Thermobifida cellulosilytica TB100]
MSTDPSPRRAALVGRVSAAGRELSNAAVVFHTVLAERLGLGATEWKILDLLERHGPLTAGELVRRSGLAPASITGVVDRLQRRGYVQRGRDPQDGRRVVVRISDTDALHRDVGSAFTGLLARLEKLYERYTDEQLETVDGFLREAARLQREAAAEMAEGGGDDR